MSSQKLYYQIAKECMEEFPDGVHVFKAEELTRFIILVMERYEAVLAINRTKCCKENYD